MKNKSYSLSYVSNKIYTITIVKQLHEYNNSVEIFEEKYLQAFSFLDQQCHEMGLTADFHHENDSQKTELGQDKCCVAVGDFQKMVPRKMEDLDYVHSLNYSQKTTQKVNIGILKYMKQILMYIF